MSEIISLKQYTTKEILEILQNPETNISYTDNELFSNIKKRISPDLKKDFCTNLPHQEIKNFVDSIGKQILSKFSEEEIKLLQWEHVGSTSILGMPGTRYPDSLLIYEKFPPTEKILDAINDSSFHFFNVEKEMNSTDLKFMRYISEEGFMKGGVMALHLVEATSLTGKYLIGLRDLCRSEQWAYVLYKSIKLKTASESNDFSDYKRLKSQEIENKLAKAIEMRIKNQFTSDSN